MKYSFLSPLVVLFAALELNAAESVNFGNVTIGENIEQQEVNFLPADQDFRVESFRSTPHISVTPSAAGTVFFEISPTQNIDFRGAAFARVSDNFGNQYSIPVPVFAEPHYSEAYDLTTYNKYGDELISAFREYLNSVHHTFSYNDARDIMYGYVDNYDGIVECPYTGNTIAVTKRPEGTDNFDTEHTWPQMFGAAEEPEKTNMHHMRPSWKPANNKRGNTSFGNVASNVTYEEGGSRYGKNENGTWVFEVRDEYKGDIARGIFYFALHYGNKANNNNANDLYLDQVQYDVLKAWSNFDLPTQRENERNARIMERQGTENPFIEHPEIHERMNLIGEFERKGNVTCGDSMLVFTTAEYLPVNFFSDIDNSIEYIRFDSTNTNFDYVKDISNVTAGEVFSLNIRHTPDCDTPDQHGILRVGFADGSEFSVYLKAEPTSCIKNIPVENTNVSVYPNPATNEAKIVLNTNPTAVNPIISFYTLAGEEVFPAFTSYQSAGKNEFSVDVRSLPIGSIYFIINDNSTAYNGIININK